MLNPLVPIISGLLGLLVIAAAVFFLVKGVWVKKRQLCPANQWTTIISNFGTGMPRTFQIRFTSKDGSPVSGRYSEKKYLWILPLAPKEGDLQAELSFHRDWINAMYVLKIYPTSDTVVEM